jgi:NAD(P)-dependent dehydrogenase (short-subunit alcohol dehydrogenase family)
MEQKAIFITGAASGIGRATAVLFHQKGWVIGAYGLSKELQSNIITGVLDVTDKSAFDAAMTGFGEQTEGRLDIIFNNAGIAIGGLLESIPFDKVISTVNVNLIGVLNGIHAAIPLLKATDNSLCFSTSSSAATYGTPGMATYSATKYAIKGLTEALSVEFARFGSRAADVSPGIIDTPLWEGKSYVRGEERKVTNFAKLNVNRSDSGRTIGAEVVAQCVWDAYHSDTLHWYIPPELVERDRAKSATPEKLRDELIAQQTK